MATYPTGQGKTLGPTGRKRAAAPWKTRQPEKRVRTSGWKHLTPEEEAEFRSRAGRSGWRLGIPQGMRRAEATARRKAGAKATDRQLKIIVERNLTTYNQAPTNVEFDEDGKPVAYMPGPYEARGLGAEEIDMANGALRFAMDVVNSGIDPIPVRLQAAKLVLDFTKAKPAQKNTLQIEAAEAFLSSIGV